MLNPATSYGTEIHMDSPRVDDFTKENYKTDTVVLAGDAAQATEYLEGTPLAVLTGGANLGKYVPYDPAGANGADTCVGLLAKSGGITADALYVVDRTGTQVAQDMVSAIFYSGRFDYAVLTALGLDATAIGQLNGQVTGNVFSF